VLDVAELEEDEEVNWDADEDVEEDVEVELELTEVT